MTDGGRPQRRSLQDLNTGPSWLQLTPMGVASTHSFSMFDLRAGVCDEFRARDTTQSLPFLSPNAVSSSCNLVCTIIGARHDAVNVTMQSITHTVSAYRDPAFTS